MIIPNICNPTSVLPNLTPGARFSLMAHTNHPLQVNHLGHFLLTLELLPLITSSAPDARVVIVSSMLHKWSDPFDPSNLEGEQNYNRYKQYGLTKLCNVSQHCVFMLSPPSTPVQQHSYDDCLHSSLTAV